MVLCKQPLMQEITISLSKLQLCSLFPVSFSNYRQPLQPQVMAGPPSVCFKTEKDMSSVFQHGVFSSLKIRALWSLSCHHGSIHCTKLTSQGCPRFLEVLAQVCPCFVVLFGAAQHTSCQSNTSPRLSAAWQQQVLFPQSCTVAVLRAVVAM